MNGIGRAKAVGRDRWQEFAQLIDQPANRALVEELLTDPVFTQAPSDARFELALNAMKNSKRPNRAGARKPTTTKWQAQDKAIAAEVIETSRSVELKFKSKDAGSFGRFLAANLDTLYEQFLKQGDEAEK